MSQKVTSSSHYMFEMSASKTYQYLDVDELKRCIKNEWAHLNRAVH